MTQGRISRRLALWSAACLVLALGCRSEQPSTVADSAPPEAPPAAAPAPTPESAATLIEIPNARMPWPNILVGGQPSVEQVEAAAEAGYRTIVNLRGPGEQGEWDEASKAQELSMRYVALPIAGAEALNADSASQLADILDGPQALPAIVHCASGNRVAALFALKAHHIDGVDAEAALEIGREAGLTQLEGAVKEKLGLTQ